MRVFEMLGFWKGSIFLIFFAALLQAGEAFISMKGSCRHPAVTSDGKNIYLVWLYSEKRPSTVYFKKSCDEGKTWGKECRVSREEGDCLPPAIALSPGIIHLAWVDCGNVIDGEICYTRSLDKGGSWEQERVLVTNSNSAQYPSISCDGANVYLIWQDVTTKVFIKASHDSGKTWEKEVLLGEVGKHSCYCYPPSIWTKENNVLVVWGDLNEDRKGRSNTRRLFSRSKEEERIYSIVCRKSIDRGATWSREYILTYNKIPKEIQGEIDNPALFSDGTKSYLFWVDKHNLPLGELKFASFDPLTIKEAITGKTLFPMSKRSPKCPYAEFDGSGNLHLVWTSFFGGESVVHYGVIDASGNVITGKKDLTSDAGRYINPVMVRTLSGIMHVFWFDKPENKNQGAKIFLKTSSDNGTTWEERGSPKEEEGDLSKE